MQPEDQERPTEAYARPGQYDWARRELVFDPDRGADGTQQQEAVPHATAAKGSAGSGQGGEE
eukprot:5117680-Heterocapsa_arctica.AAC.1